jgi:hypothetical protein
MIRHSSSGLSALNEITNIINPIINSPIGKLIVDKQYYPDFMKSTYRPLVNEANIYLANLKNQYNTEADSNQEHTMTCSDENVEWNKVEPELRYLKRTRNGLVFRKFTNFNNIQAKNMLCDWIDRDVYTQKELQMRYSITSKNILRWWNKFRGERNQQSGWFRKIDDVKKGEIVMAVEESAKDHMHLLEEIVDRMLEVAAYANSIERGKLNEDVKKMGLSKTTKWRVKKQLSLKSRSTNDSTLARLAACKDPFSSVAWAAINWCVASRLPADCKANADATTIFMQTDKKTNKAMVYFSSEEGEKCKRSFTKRSSYEYNKKENDSSTQNDTNVNEYFKKSSLETGVKYLHLSFANGRSGPATLVFALDSIPVDKFERFLLPRFTTPNSLSVPAVVYFCK